MLEPIFFLSIFSVLGSFCDAAASVSQAEFNAALKSNGFKVQKAEIYNHFVEGTKDFTREETAMFLAQLLHESVGFAFREELMCLRAGNDCATRYKDRVGLPGKVYYGRGYIQLTWGENYRAASRALGMGDKLLQQPELVARDTRLSMLVSSWFWKAKVRPRLSGANRNKFGATTRAINAGECTSARLHERAKKRWRIYEKVAKALNVGHKAIENGCYN
ncbi:hypothetical protein TKK_0007489 [Trichogramma kaykai]|uniref:Glycoside hydrolase family 19 catalytic domain-containing protein n=1 Tax=Trichogramma kaykai TaxID=54128 RepID=A0ABD2WHI8_9HYME